MKKSIFVLMFALVFISFASATTEYVFELNESVNFGFICLDTDNSLCNDQTVCNIIQLQDPEGFTSVLNSSLTYNNTNYNASIPTTKLGTYSMLWGCQGSSNGTASFNYEVTRSGAKIGTGEGILYIIILTITFALFMLFSFRFIQTEWNDGKDGIGRIVEINYNKYFKFLWGFLSYLTLLFIFVICKGITQSFLFLDVAYGFFNVGMVILLAFLGPGIIVCTFFFAINLVADKRNAKTLARGLTPR